MDADIFPLRQIIFERETLGILAHLDTLTILSDKYCHGVTLSDTGNVLNWPDSKKKRLLFPNHNQVTYKCPLNKGAEKNR